MEVTGGRVLTWGQLTAAIKCACRATCRIRRRRARPSAATVTEGRREKDWGEWGEGRLTFMPRLVRNMPHALQSRIQTLWGSGLGGGATNGWTWMTRG